jgi:hypothetical protein
MIPMVRLGPLYTDEILILIGNGRLVSDWWILGLVLRM